MKMTGAHAPSWFIPDAETQQREDARLQISSERAYLTAVCYTCIHTHYFRQQCKSKRGILGSNQMFLLLESRLKTRRFWKTQRCGDPGLEHVTRRAACCGGADRKGSEAPLQRPDAPQRRAGGNADSAGRVEGWAGTNPSSRAAGGTSSVASLNQRSVRLSRIYEMLENEHRG